MTIGPAVTIVPSGGYPVRQVTSGGAPLTAVSSGGFPVTISDNGAPFVIEGGGTPAPSPTPTLATPTLVLATDPNPSNNRPWFDIDTGAVYPDGIYFDDVVAFQWGTSEAAAIALTPSEVVFEEAWVLDPTDNPPSPGLVAFTQAQAGGTVVHYRIRGKGGAHRVGSDIRSDSAWSNFLTYTVTAADVTAPTLSAASDTANGDNAMTGSVTTNEAGGTLYYFISTSAVPPTAANLKTGTGSAAFGSQAVAASGAQAIAKNGLIAATTYYTHYLHRDAAGNDSAIVSADGFTTTGSAFNPLTVFEDYWDAGDESTITGSGNTLSMANKISGGVAIIPHTTGTAFTSGDETKDVNGLNTLYTSGSAGRMRTSAAKVYSDTFHIFLVEYFDPTVWGGVTATLFSMGDPTDATPIFWLGNQSAAAPTSPSYVRQATGGSSGALSGGQPATAAHLWEFRATDGGNMLVFCDGVQRYSTAWTGFDGTAVSFGLFYLLFGTNRASGRFCSLAINDGAVLAGAELTAAQNYFASRWGITL